ncbi:MAG TPA: hypothetical protein VG319_05710 [Polyangia bacterium]|nr:hypothetical protein [Polyangia bacterium]
MIGGSAALAAALFSCQEPVPKTPTFEVDVKPIFQAHCVRCHGAGGTLNADPRAFEAVPPPNGFLGQYDDKVSCALDATGNIPANCLRGALSEAKDGYLAYYLHTKSVIRMPMSPSGPLAPWELDVIDNWLAESPPAP